MKAVKATVSGSWRSRWAEGIRGRQAGSRRQSKFVWREWPYTEGYVANEEGLVACKIYKTCRRAACGT
jgi:hypothetical protein